MFKVTKTVWQKPIQLITTRFGSVHRVKPLKKVTNIVPTKSLEGPRIESMAAKLKSKGYLRPFKGYSPPENVNGQILPLIQQFNLKENEKFNNNKQKFEFLAACFTTFQHSIPNSQLCEIESVQDVINYYKTQVDVKLPLDSVKTVDLPENLYIQQEPVRFHPETDTKFGGKTAFPKSSTIVTGLKYKDKYKGHIAKKSWP